MHRFANALEGTIPHADPDVVVRPVRVPGAASPGAGRYVQRWVRHPLAVRRARGDVFHITDHSDAHLAALLPPERTVVTCHDVLLLRMAEEDLGMRPPALWLARFRASVSFLRRVAAVTCPSEATRDDVVRLCGVSPERVHVIPHGVEESFRPLGPEVRQSVRDGLPRGQLLLHVSSGGFYKNAETTLRLLGRLRQDGRDVVLCRVGTGLSAAQQELAKDLGVTPWVHDLGTVPEERLVELYAAADLLVFPSLFEGFGWPPLEAMACGTPVLVSQDPALLALVDEAGLSAPARAVDALARQARRVLDDPAVAQELAHRGLDRAREYRWPTVAPLFTELYRTVATGASAPA